MLFLILQCLGSRFPLRMCANWIWNQFREEQGSKAEHCKNKKGEKTNIWVKSSPISPPNKNDIISIIIQNNYYFLWNWTFFFFFCIDFGVKYDLDIFQTEHHFINIFLLCFHLVLVSYTSFLPPPPPHSSLLWGVVVQRVTNFHAGPV